MCGFRNFIGFALLLCVAVYVNADCDKCVATFNLSSCGNTQVCTTEHYVCHDSLNPQTRCVPADYTPVLIRGSQCNETGTTTSTTTTTTTTTTARPSGERTPNEICAAEHRHGFFPHDNDTTCVWFFQCYVLDNEWMAIGFMCPVRFYFDRDMGFCVPYKPAYCQ